MNFESELKQGRLVIGRCTKCNNTNWPPSDSCNVCFGEISWSPIKQPGTLIEWSTKENQVFGIVEFENIRLIGAIPNQTNLTQGQKMKISSCGFDGRPKYTFALDP